MIPAPGRVGKKDYCSRYRGSEEAQDKANLQVEQEMQEAWLIKLLQQWAMSKSGIFQLMQI